MWAVQVSFHTHTNLRFSSFGPQHGWMLLPVSPCRAWIKTYSRSRTWFYKKSETTEIKKKKKRKKINIFFVKKIKNSGCICFQLIWCGRPYAKWQVQQKCDRCMLKTFVLSISISYLSIWFTKQYILKVSTLSSTAVFKLTAAHHIRFKSIRIINAIKLAE